jgi:type I restriction enzyme S subunit
MTWQMRKVSALIDVQKRKHKLKTNEYLAAGRVPIVDQGADFIAAFTEDAGRAYDGPLPVVIFGDHTCCLKFVDFKFAVGADGTQVLRPVEGVNGRYLYYALHTADLEQFGYQRHFKLLKECEVAVPDLETQLRIASILGAYDDLIEVNRRRVAILEEMARRLFAEWFVHFRFPDYDQVVTVDTPEALPKGWRVTELGSVLRLRYGKALKADTRVPGPVAVIGSSGVVGSHTEQFVDGPGIVVGRKGNVGSVIWSAGDFWPIDTAYFVETELPLTFAFELLRRIPFQNTDAAVPGLNRDYAQSRRVVVPPTELIERFGAFAHPIRQQRDALEQANERLGASRDMLLPRLISGQLSLEAAERQLEDAG